MVFQAAQQVDVTARRRCAGTLQARAHVAAVGERRRSSRHQQQHHHHHRYHPWHLPGGSSGRARAGVLPRACSGRGQGRHGTGRSPEHPASGRGRSRWAAAFPCCSALSPSSEPM